MRMTILLALAGIWSATAALAQGTFGQITGKVTDPSGAAVPAATVTVTNVDTALRRETASNEQGNYAAPLLPAGTYRITILKEGFKPVIRGGISVAVNQTVRIDVILELGSVTETVEVVAAAPLIEQDTSALGQVIDHSKIVNIPIIGRSPFRLVQLTTNVLTAPSANGQYGDVPVNTQDDSMISIGGGRARTNEVLIDGIPSTTGFVNQLTTIPNVDSTLEFKVQSSNLSAEWGRFGGGVINVSTRPGTNELHGSVYEFFRNNALDANEFFNKRAGRDSPPFRMNQFGFAVGGPVFLPKIYSGKDRTFFFTDYQGTRWRRGEVSLFTVPTAAQRAGDFSQTFTQAGQQIVVYDPESTRPDPARAGRFLRDPFAGNVVPQSRMNPVGLNLASYYPMPNTAGSPVTQTNNYISNASRGIDQAAYTTRIDHSLAQFWQMFGRVSVNRSTLAQPDSFGNPATSGDGANGRVLLNNYSAGLDNTVTLGPATILNVRYGMARFYWARLTRSFGFDQRELGFPESHVRQLVYPLFPIASVEGFAQLGGSNVLRTGQDTHSILGSATHLRGKHHIKAGGDLRIRRLNFTSGQGAGSYTFNRVMTRGPDPNVVTATGGVGFASLLLGTPSGGSFGIVSGNSLQNFYYAGYLQDDIRLSSRLTLNLGVRYETESPLSERYNQINWFDFHLPSPVRNAAFPNLTGGLVFASAEDRTIYSWDRNNVAPRAGFAYTLTKTTILRGGAGVFYAPPGVSDRDFFAPTSGFSSSTPMLATLDGITPYRYVSNPFPDGFVPPTGASLGPSTFLGQGIQVWDRAVRTPYALQWNLDVQQALRQDLLLDVAYSASRGVKLNAERQFNALPPEHLALGTGLQTLVDNPFYPNIPTGTLAQPRVQRSQLLLPFPQFTGVTHENSSWGNSIYHSVAFKFEKRATKGVGFLLSYTIGKLISDVRNSHARNGAQVNSGLNTNVQNWYDLRSERAVAEIDAAQSLSFSYVAELPFGRGRRYLSGARGLGAKLAEGWQLSGFFACRSGFPLALSASIAGGGNRPNSTGQSAKLPGGRSRDDQVNQWFDTSAFTQPPSYSFGNVSRTLPDVRGPNFANWNMSLAKNVTLHEKMLLQFRAESFNFLNRPNFWRPNTVFGSLQFGQLNATTGLPRVNQLALKLIF
jgi:hypothetical protein